MKWEILIKLLTLKDISQRSVAQELFGSLLRIAPDYMFERYDIYEPRRKKYEGDLEPFLKLWEEDEEGVGWVRRSTPRVEGGVGWGGIHKRLFMAASYRKKDTAGAVELFKEWIEILEPDVALITLGGSRPDDDRAHEIWGAMDVDFNSYHLYAVGLPGVPWGFWLGRPYVELFGAEKLESAPVHHVEKRGGGYFLQLSEHLEDMKEQNAELVALAEEVKVHLGEDAFRVLGVDETQLCTRLPRFAVTQEQQDSLDDGRARWREPWPVVQKGKEDSEIT